MKRILSIALLAALASGCSHSAADRTLVTGDAQHFDTLSYAIGSDLAYSLQYGPIGSKINKEQVCAGIDRVARGRDRSKAEEVTKRLNDFFASKRDVMQSDSVDLFRDDAQRDSISFLLGVDVANNLNKGAFPVQGYWIGQALADNLPVDSTAIRMTQQQVWDYLQHYFMIVRPAQNEKASIEWLTGIADKRGVQRTESGLLYKIVKAGDESVRAVSDKDMVKVHYVGYTRTGKKFDSSYDRKEPAEFPVGGVIKGWAEGVKLIGKGGKIKLWIPSALAYGPRGAGAQIGPNEALYFEIELLDVTPEQPQLMEMKSDGVSGAAPEEVKQAPAKESVNAEAVPAKK